MALQYGQAVARRMHARLTVTYVNDPLLVAAAAAALRDRGLVRRSEKALDAFVTENLQAGAKASLRVKSSVSVGSPVEEIITTAARNKSDLIVVGGQGLTGAERIVLGSTTLGILQHTTVPVLAVPRRTAFNGDVPAEWPGATIIAALDLAASARQDVEVAAHIARSFGASLLLVHALERVATPGWLGADLSAHDRIRAGEARRLLDELCVIARRQVPAEARVVEGLAADEIAALVAERRIQLLITALRGRHSWFGSRRGSVSYHVLSHAVAPVLAYPSQWRPR